MRLYIWILSAFFPPQTKLEEKIGEKIKTTNYSKKTKGGSLN